MKDVRVTFGLYNDMKPRETLVNGVEPKPILKDREGKEYFEAKAGMVLTVSEERAKYLVEDRKLAEYMEGTVNNDNNNDDNLDDKDNQDTKEDKSDDNEQEDKDNNDNDEDKENKDLNNENKIETADKKVNNLETAVKKTGKKSNKK